MKKRNLTITTFILLLIVSLTGMAQQSLTPANLKGCTERFENTTAFKRNKCVLINVVEYDIYGNCEVNLACTHKNRVYPYSATLKLGRDFDYCHAEDWTQPCSDLSRQYKNR